MTPTTHCRMSCTSDCRERMATPTSWKYMLFFEGGRKLFPKLGTALKNNKVFSNVCSELCGTVIYETLTA
jgi:hypothetical protein